VAWRNCGSTDCVPSGGWILCFDVAHITSSTTLVSPNPGELEGIPAPAATPPAHSACVLGFCFPAMPAATPGHGGQLVVEFAMLLEDFEDRLDAYHDDEPLRYRTVTNIIGD
jgi:hypothetical protein